MPKLKTLGPFFGISNRLPDSALHVATRYDLGDVVRDAVNVDVDNAGRFLHRLEPELVEALPGAHDLFMTSKDAGYLVHDSAIVAVTLPEYEETPLAWLASDARMCWVGYGSDLFYSNGTDIGRITDGVAYPAALPTPEAPEAELASIAGLLSKGMYRAAVSYVNDLTGEEGGLSPFAAVDLPGDSGITILSPPEAPGATHFNVYVTAPNGEALLRFGTFPLGPAVTILGAASGRESHRDARDPLPPGRLFVSSGRLCSFSGNTVTLGLPYWPGYCDPLGGRLDFPAEVSVVVDVQDGLYVAADKTYWIPHGDGAVIDVLPYGAVKGTEFALPGEPLAGWFGKEGFVLAGPGGKVTVPMSENVEVGPLPGEGFSMVIDEEFTRVVSCGWCMRLEGDRKPATRYEDWPLTSWSRGYGTTIDGIVRLARAPGPWNVDFGRLDFGDSAEKYLPNVYAGVQSKDRLILRVRAPGKYGGDYSYEALRHSPALDVQRFDVGRGLRGNWFHLSLSGAEGTEFRLAKIEFVAASSQRRI
jgi:hypothetical protein